MAKYLANKLNSKKAAVIYVNNEYGTGLANAFESTFVAEGGLIVLKEKYDQGSSDFRTILSKLNGKNFDAIYLPGQPRENGFLVRQIKEIGINTILTANLSVESPDFYTTVKDAGEGIFFSTPAFDVSSNDQNIKEFVNSYEAHYKIKPDAVAGHAFDAANIMIQAIVKANYDIAKVKDHLYRIENFPGITGTTSFDDHGDVVKAVMIKKLNLDGSSVILETYKP